VTPALNLHAGSGDEGSELPASIVYICKVVLMLSSYTVSLPCNSAIFPFHLAIA
jgi:hypothetical protein